MVMLKGSIQNGQVHLSQPTDLPDGTEVMVLANGVPETIGIPDDQWPTDPDGISKLIARMERVEPFEMTPAEEAEAQAWRHRVKKYTLAHQDSAIEGIFK